MPDISMIETYFFLLVVYSVIGWFYECIVESIRQKKIVNRGFLNGPYCPIYGFGALLDVLVLGWCKEPVMLFILSAVLTCTLEYITSVVMEKLFNARWWDYYDFKFNLNGRVCLLGALAFGTLSILLVNFIHPFFLWVTGMIQPTVFHVICLMMFLLVVMDIVITVAGFSSFDGKLKELSININNIKNNIDVKVNSSNTVEKLTAAYSKFTQSLNSQQIRLLKSFPKLRSIKYGSVSEEIKKFIFRKKNK